MSQPAIPLPRSGQDYSLPDRDIRRAGEWRVRRDLALQLRRRLAIAAAEMTAHGIPGAIDVHHALLQQEAMIKDEFPGTWASPKAGLQAWVLADAALLHEEDETRPGCSLCRELALGHDLSVSLPIT